MPKVTLPREHFSQNKLWSPQINSKHLLSIPMRALHCNLQKKAHKIQNRQFLKIKYGIVCQPLLARRTKFLILATYLDFVSFQSFFDCTITILNIKKA